MSVRGRAIAAAGIVAAVAALSGLSSQSVGASVHRSAVIVPAPSASSGDVAGNVRLEVGPVDPSPPVAATRGDTRAASYQVFDDRKLARRTGGWSPVSAGKAYLDTLTCASAKGQTLRIKKAAAEGGDVRVQTGRGRGSIEIRVGGAVVTRATTSARRTGFTNIAFTGAGTVDIRISTAGKRVCVDSARLVMPEVLLSGRIRQLGVNARGTGPDNEVINAEVSAGGSMVAFWSRAGNLAAGTNDGVMRLFVASVKTGKVLAVVATDPASSDNERALAWSPVYQGDTDSRYLVFGSHATNLGPDVSGRVAPYMYVADFEADTIGFLAEGVTSAAWSPDGLKIAFATRAQYGPDPNMDDDLWSLDLSVDPGDANLTAISTTSAGAFTNTSPNGSWQPSWSPDSKKVMFTSWSSGLVSGDTNTSRDIFMKNLASGATTRVSLGRNGTQLNSYSEHGTFSPDGRLIAFTSAADNVVTGDTNAGTDVFVRELSSGQVALVSTNYRGEPSLFDHDRPHWSPDGGRIAFRSEGVDLLSTTVDANQRDDIYIKNLVTDANQIVSITPDRRFGNSDSSTFIGEYSNNAWLPDGSGVVFLSRSTNLATSSANGFSRQIYLKLL